MKRSAMKRETERLIELITAWILKAFLGIAPKLPGCVMGTALLGDKGRSVPPGFLPNLRNFLDNSSRGAGAHTRELPTLSTKPFALSTGPFALSTEPIALSSPPSALPTSPFALPIGGNRSQIRAFRSLRKPNLSIPKSHLLPPESESLQL